MTYETIIKTELEEGRTVNNSSELFEFISELLPPRNQEQMVLVTFDECKQVIQSHIVHVGESKSETMDIKDIIKRAIMDDAKSIAMCFIRPTKDLTIRREDRLKAERLYRAGKIFLLPIRHILIIVKHGFTEIKNDRNDDEGMIYPLDPKKI
jgi:DNA repair protein RadC